MPYYQSSNYPLYIAIPDNNGNFTRILRRWKFRDSNKVFYFEPRFHLNHATDKIERKDALFEDNQVISPQSSGFKPVKLNDYRHYCHAQLTKYKNEEVYINPIAVAYGMKEPIYSIKEIESTKYHL